MPEQGILLSLVVGVPVRVHLVDREVALDAIAILWREGFQRVARLASIQPSGLLPEGSLQGCPESTEQAGLIRWLGGSNRGFKRPYDADILPASEVIRCFADDPDIFPSIGHSPPIHPGERIESPRCLGFFASWCPSGTQPHLRKAAPKQAAQ